MIAIMWTNMFVKNAYAVTIENPISATSFEGLLQTLTNQLLPIAILLGVLAIILTGFQMIIATLGGNTSGLATAKKHLTWALIGTAIVVAAYALAEAAVQFAQEL